MVTAVGDRAHPEVMVDTPELELVPAIGKRSWWSCLCRWERHKGSYGQQQGRYQHHRQGTQNQPVHFYASTFLSPPFQFSFLLFDLIFTTFLGISSPLSALPGTSPAGLDHLLQLLQRVGKTLGSDHAPAIYRVKEGRARHLVCPGYIILPGQNGEGQPLFNQSPVLLW